MTRPGRKGPALDAEAFALDLAGRIREAVVPLFGRPEARRRTGQAPGGDTTYAIDEVAERVVQQAFDHAGDVAYFTEDAGLVVRGSPDILFLVDPIDGTRPSTAGFETCCVSVAVGPYGRDVMLGDLSYGVVLEITTGAWFEARKGGGARAEGRTLSPSGARGLDGMFWAGGFRGQPAVATAAVLAGLFDVAGVRGAFFDQGSAAYSLTRVATGQLDAYVDPGASLAEEVPELEGAFRAVGGGHVLNTATYDMASGYLLLRELGCPVTDARGGSLDGVALVGEEEKARMVSTVASATLELHEAVLTALDEGLARASRLLEAVGVEGLLGQAPRREG